MTPDQDTLDEIARRLSGHRAEEWTVLTVMRAAPNDDKVEWKAVNGNGLPSVTFTDHLPAFHFARTGEMPDDYDVDL